MDIKYSDIKIVSVAKFSLISAWLTLIPLVTVIAYFKLTPFELTDVIASILFALFLSGMITIVLTAGVGIVRLFWPRKTAIKTNDKNQSLADVFG